MKCLLVVSPDASWNEGLDIALESVGIRTLGTRTHEEALAELNRKKGDFGGVLIGAMPAPGQNEADAALKAVDLLGAVRNDESEIPILLWAPYPIEPLSHIVGRVKGSVMLLRDTAESISEALHGLSAPVPATNEPPVGKVEMEIGAANIRVVFAVTGKGVVTEITRTWTGRKKLARMERKFLNWELRRRSDVEIHYADDWDQTFQETGEDLADELAYSAEEFGKGMSRCLDDVGTVDNIHFRFSLLTDGPELSHPFVHVPFELLYDTSKNHFVRSLAPVARRICLHDGSLTAKPLANAKSLSGPLLFVKSNAHGSLVLRGNLFNGKARLVFPKLDALDAEFEGVQRARAEARSEAPAPIQLSLTAGQDTVTLLREAMLPQDGRTPQLQILHFAGHSVRADDGAVFLILPGDAPGKVVPLSIHDFANWARHCELRLVLLSSCQSSSPDAIFRLAQAGIPSVIGFRWEVDDKEAAFFTQSLHHQLAKQVSLARAFHRAVSESQTKYPASPTFASAMLVVQGEEWTI
ncbi:MAG: CHAT domain-containing protein [Xanthobacteraceae bacterium]